MRRTCFFLFAFLLLQHMLAAQGILRDPKRLAEIRLTALKTSIAPLVLKKSQLKRLTDYFMQCVERRQEFTRRIPHQGVLAIAVEVRERGTCLYQLECFGAGTTIGTGFVLLGKDN